MTNIHDDNLDHIEIDLGTLEESEEVGLNFDLPTSSTGEIGVEFDDAADDDTEDGVVDEEAIIERLRARLNGQIGDWYVIHTYSGMENRVKQNLDARVVTLGMEDYIFETVVPTDDVVEIRNGQKKTVTRTVLPGYVLVRMDMTDESWTAVRHTPSVTGFVAHASSPVPLSIEEVVKMLTPAEISKANAEVAGKPVRKKKVVVADFNVGDAVTVTDGPFSGVHGTITEINSGSQRLKVLVDFMGRETPVDLTFTQVERL